MKSAESRHEQIEQYLRGQLPPAQAAEFESEVASDPELAALLHRHRLERQGLELLVERDLIAKMQAWDREAAFRQAPPTAKTGGRVFRMAWRIAAVLTLAAFGWWLLRDASPAAPDPAPTVVHTQPGKKNRPPATRPPAAVRPKPAAPQTPSPEPEKTPGEIASRPALQPEPSATLPPPAPAQPDYAALADEFYRDRDFSAPPGTKDGSGSASLDQAKQQFRNGRYDDVISQLRPATPGASDPQRRELLALALYKDGQWDAAYAAFRELAASARPPYTQRAEWGMALTLLHQMPAKQPLLQRVLENILSDPKHLFFERAKALEKRL